MLDLLKVISFVNINPSLLGPECSFPSWGYGASFSIVMLAPLLFLSWIVASTGAYVAHRWFTSRYGAHFEEKYPGLFIKVTGRPYRSEKPKRPPAYLAAFVRKLGYTPSL